MPDSPTAEPHFEVADEVTVAPDRALVHASGWQSWSPTGTYPVLDHSPVPEHDWQYRMRFRPGSPCVTSGFQAEGLLVVDDGLGGPIRLYGPGGFDGLDEIPTIRADLAGDRLLISSDGPLQVAAVDGSMADALAAFGEDWAARCHIGAIRTAPRVWCTWYRYFLDVTPADIEENLEAIRRRDLPVDVIQIDDGWEAGIGDWEPGTRFRTLPHLIGRIRDEGFRAGLWLAPLTVGSRSRLAREHPDWLVGDGGRNWGQSLHGLDVTHPEAGGHLTQSLRHIRDLGIDYVKLDFLYTGALPGRRHDDVSPLAAYRRGLQLVREALGERTYVLGCGAPILPSVGLVDAMRVSADVYNPDDDQPGTQTLRGVQAITERAWQHGRLWVNDPDCLIARPAFPLRQEWARVIDRFGGLRSASDRIAELDEWGLATTRRLLSTAPPPTAFREAL
jgi:alpha-galactosidase